MKAVRIFLFSIVLTFAFSFNDGYCLSIVPPPLGWAEIFTPEQKLIFSILEREASYYLTEFGWYNIDEPSALYTIFGPYLPDAIPPGIVPDVTVIFDSSNPDYHGGAIGFFLKVPYTDPPDPNATFYYFTQGSLDNPATMFDHSLVYATEQANTYLIKWEDYEHQGNSDKDFNDLVVAIKGITPVSEPSLLVLFSIGLSIVLNSNKRKKLYRR